MGTQSNGQTVEQALNEANQARDLALSEILEVCGRMSSNELVRVMKMIEAFWDARRESLAGDQAALAQPAEVGSKAA